MVQQTNAKKIAIIGAGFSGLAVAWHLAQRAEVTVFDAAGIGGGASGMAAGLMHPYAGLHSKLNWKGHEGMNASKKLLAIASEALGMPVASATGLLRVALSESQHIDYAHCASVHPDVEWRDSCAPWLPKPGIFIRDALTVNCPLYLKGLWLACEQLGARFEQREINELQELDAYGTIVLATGASKRFTSLPITPLKGQILRYRWPEKDPLPTSINSHAYIVMDQDQKSCFGGATFERQFDSPLPNIKVALADIQPRVAALYPALTEELVIECRAGIRASTPDHRPIVAQLNPKTWIITGMGSRGLLYHALCAEELALHSKFLFNH